MQGVIFNYLTSKILPVSRRGSLMGLEILLADFLHLCSLSLLEIISLVIKINWRYSYSFIIAFFIHFGLFALGLIREPAPPEIGEKQL